MVFQVAKQNGFQTKEKIRVEIFPDTKAFYFASSLSARDIEVAGAVGLTNFNKLMVLSPRALVYGYRWLDAISHEYMHYLIVKLTSNKAPIWFHEGLAKYEETRWRNGPSYLSLLYQTLLARALAERKLIGFDRMEPSLLRLETPEEVQLAYAQAASAIEKSRLLQEQVAGLQLEHELKLASDIQSRMLPRTNPAGLRGNCPLIDVESAAGVAGGGLSGGMFWPLPAEARVKNSASAKNPLRPGG
jgi:hypothetical protein